MTMEPVVAFSVLLLDVLIGDSVTADQGNGLTYVYPGDSSNRQIKTKFKKLGASRI